MNYIVKRSIYLQNLREMHPIRIPPQVKPIQECSLLRALVVRQRVILLLLLKVLVQTVPIVIGSPTMIKLSPVISIVSSHLYIQEFKGGGGLNYRKFYNHIKIITKVHYLIAVIADEKYIFVKIPKLKKLIFI